ERPGVGELERHERPVEGGERRVGRDVREQSGQVGASEMDLRARADLFRPQKAKDSRRSVSAPREEDRVDAAVVDELAIAGGPLRVGPREEAVPPAQVGGLDDLVAAGGQGAETGLQPRLVDRTGDRGHADRGAGSQAWRLQQNGPGSHREESPRSNRAEAAATSMVPPGVSRGGLTRGAPGLTSETLSAAGRN